jgi:hypothetical protein
MEPTPEESTPEAPDAEAAQKPERPVPERTALVFDDPLSRPGRDDTDSGWGGEGESGRDEAWYRRETPPHHGG